MRQFTHNPCIFMHLPPLLLPFSEIYTIWRVDCPHFSFLGLPSLYISKYSL